MKIPKEFQLFGSTIKVYFNNDKCDEHNAHGAACYKSDKIYLQEGNYGGYLMSKTEIECTFLHEMLHFIFEKLDEKDLSKNEKLISNISRALHQILTTQKF